MRGDEALRSGAKSLIAAAALFGELERAIGRAAAALSGFGGEMDRAVVAKSIRLRARREARREARQVKWRAMNL